MEIKENSPNNGGENAGFSYTYSAKEQAEIKKIREKYIVEQTDGDDKMARLRKLDSAVTGKAQAVAISCGIIGALVMGFGMSLIMTELFAMLGMEKLTSIITGLLCGVAGCVLVSFAYPIYKLVLNRERARIAPEIIRLSDELIK